MKRSTRLLAMLVLIEAGLAGLWLWLIAALETGEMTPAGDPAETVAIISSTVGGVMGLLAAIVLVAAFIMRRRGV